MFSWSCPILLSISNLVSHFHCVGCSQFSFRLFKLNRKRLFIFVRGSQTSKNPIVSNRLQTASYYPSRTSACDKSSQKLGASRTIHAKQKLTLTFLSISVFNSEKRGSDERCSTILPSIFISKPCSQSIPTLLIITALKELSNYDLASLKNDSQSV